MRRLTSSARRQKRRPGCRRRRSDRGSSLMLVPAGVMVVVLLGAIAVDLSAAHLAQRRLVQATERAADDAAGMLDRDALRLGEAVRVNPTAASNLARLQMSALEVPGLQGSTTSVGLTPDGQGVSVRTTATVKRLFGRRLPGVSPTYRVTAHATARLE